MRPIVLLPIALAALVGMSASGCSGSNSQSGFNGNGSSSGGGSGSSSGGSGGSSGSSSGGVNNGDGGLLTGDGSSNQPWDAEAGVTVHTTVYAHTDDTLYSVDPMTNAVTLVGTFVGTSDASTDSAVTDLAVDGAGDVYVNTESVVYKCGLPATGGTVQLTKVATIGSTNRFYALAFAPAGALDPSNETLVGGDSTGSLYVISPSGTVTNLGNFGNDPTVTPAGTNIFELSGDVVFYNDASNKPTGLATIRSCPKTGSSSKCGDDFLAGVNMTALKAAYTSGTPATTLLGGIYGGSGNALGNGTGYHDVFGLGAWNSTVFGFTRHYGTTTPTVPMLITIDTTSGAGTMVSNAFTFTNGWSGAGVTTKVTITVPPPPPPPAQ